MQATWALIILFPMTSQREDVEHTHTRFKSLKSMKTFGITYVQLRFIVRLTSFVQLLLLECLI